MALSVHVKLACLLVQLAMLFAASQVNADGAASYCDHGACSSPDMYCCGHNECCSYVVTTYYLCLALVSGLCIGFFLVWRYKNRDKNSSSNKHSVGESLLRVTSTNNPSSSSSSSGPSTSGKRYMDSFAPFAYKQLNEQVFEEKRVDDNTIMFNLKGAQGGAGSMRFIDSSMPSSNKSASNKYGVSQPQTSSSSSSTPSSYGFQRA